MVVGTPTRLNMIPSGVMPVIYLNQTDEGYDKQFLIYNGDQPYNAPEGISVTIRGKKGDLNGITENVTYTVGSNLMTAHITQQMTAVAGESNIFELVIVDTEGLRVGTINMVFAVEPDALGDAVISESEIGYAETVLTELQSVQAVNNQVQQNKANIAKEVQDRISAVNTETQNRIAAVNAEASARQAADTTLQNNVNTETNRAKAAENTLQQNISTEAAALTATDSSLQSQINQYVTPSAQQPDEVVNARVGADGITYSTLGNAIRGQVTDLKSALGVDLFTDRYVRYNGMAYFSFNADENRPSFFREGNRFGLNGSSRSTSYTFIRLNDSVEGESNIAYANASAEVWTKNVLFATGHVYRLAFNLYSGSYTSDELLVLMYKSDGTRQSVSVGSETLITGDGTTANVVLSCRASSTFTNAVFSFTIEDITEDLLNTNSKYLVGGINENNDLVKTAFIADQTKSADVPSNSDINNYTADGNYRVRSKTEAETISNLPIKYPGRLYVMHFYDSARIFQIYIAGMGYVGRIYTRYYVNSWTEWNYLDTKPVSGSDEPSPVFNSMPATKIAYSWWVKNHVMDSYGNLYFGYISEEAMCGVGCRYPDGHVERVDLFESEDNDDHNAPSVIIVERGGKEYVCVIGSTGHNTDNIMHCYIATKPNTILANFDNKSTRVVPPSGWQYQCSYSQAFFDTYTRSGVTYHRITNFFRIKQRVDGTSTPYNMVWVCAISDDYGDTWKMYRVFAIKEEDRLFYMWAANTKSPWLKRVVLQPNTTYIGYKPISAGYINISTGNILDNNAEQIGTLQEFTNEELAYVNTITSYDDFTVLIPAETDRMYRVLDVWDLNTNKLTFLYAKTTDTIDQSQTGFRNNINDWTLYRYNDGTITEVGHLGAAFFRGSAYVTGASFYNDIDHVIYSQNDSEYVTVTVDGAEIQRQLQDGPHSLHTVEIANNAVLTDKVIKTSLQTMARPLRYNKGSIMMLMGKYREGEGTSYLTWHFGIQFIDVLA